MEGDKEERELFDIEESNNSKQVDIIRVLVMDTFYDKVVGHATDGIDIAALLNSSSCLDIPLPRRHFSATKTEFSQYDFVRKLGVMLYSNRRISIDDFGEKMWRNPGANTTDFFNYGLDEKQWKAYCKEMHAFIHEQSLGTTEAIEDGEILEH